MPLTITITGDTVTECYDLLEEVTNRLKSRLDVAAPVPPIKLKGAPELPAEPKRRGRPPKARLEAVPQEEPETDEPEPEEEIEEEIEEETKVPEKALTRQDIVDALNAYAATNGGMVAGRQVIQELCGVAKLAEVKETDYPKLYARLKKAAA
jgi:hypothetical protein